MRGALGGLAAALLVGLVAGPAATAAPEAADDTIGVRLLDGPADRQDDPRALTYVVDHVAPGERIERRVAVTNTTDAAVEVDLYPGGARVDDGGFAFSPGREGTELTGWTTVEPPVVTVPAQGEAEAVVRIAVPADAAAGEQYGVVWVEPPPSWGGDVAVVHRVGVRVYLSVGAGGEPPTTFSISGVQPRRSGTGGSQLIARVRNDGGRAVDLTGELSLSGGPGGVSTGPVAAQPGTTLGVGRSGEVVFALDPALPAGPWTADVVLRSGRTERTSTTGVTLAVSGAGSGVGSRAATVLWTAGLATTALVVAVAIGLAARRRALRAVNG